MINQQQAEVTLKVNSKEAQEKLEGLKKRAAQLREEFADAFKRGDTRAIDKATKELRKVNKEMDSMRTNAANIRAAMVRLNEATPRELQRTIKRINEELNSGRVKRGSEEWNAYIEKLKAARRELKLLRQEAVDNDSAGGGLLDKLKDKAGKLTAGVAAATAALTGLVMAGKSAIESYADMQAEEANTSKYTSMTAEEVEQLNEAFKKMDTRTSREELNKMAQEAGRLGKSSVDDVLGFVRAADQINVALDDLGEGATRTLSKLTGIFGDEKVYGTEQSLLKVGSVINELSQNCSASAPYLAEFSSRLGGIAAQSKMTVSQVMAFGAVLDTQNLAVEASATAVGQLITKIYQEPAKIAKAAGLDMKKFSDMVKTDMNGALIMLFEQLNQYGGMESLATVFDNMGTDGARAIPVLSALAGHVDELKNQQLEANKAFAEGTSITKEFEVQNNTRQAQIDKDKKDLKELTVALGKQLYPAMHICMSGMKTALQILSTLVKFVIENKTAILAVTAALISYNAIAAIHNARIAITAKTTALWKAALVAAKGIMPPIRLIIAGLTNTVQYFTKGLEVNYTMQERWRKALKAMSFANWAGIAVAAITTVVLIWDKLSGAIDKTKQKFNEAIGKMGEFDLATRKEQQELEYLIGTLKGAREGSEEYKNAKDKLISQYGAYLQGLKDEKGQIIDLDAAYRRLAESIRIANQERGIKNARDAVDKTFEDEMKKHSSQLYQTLLDYGCSIQEAAQLQAAVVTAMEMGKPIDNNTRNRINAITRSGRVAVDGKGGRGARLGYNISGIANDVTGGLIGSEWRDSPAEIVNKMYGVTKTREEAHNQIDKTARINHPLGDLDDEWLERAIRAAEEASKNGGSILKIYNALAGTFEFVEATSEEAKRQLEELLTEKAYRTGSTSTTTNGGAGNFGTGDGGGSHTPPPSDKDAKKQAAEAKKAAAEAKKALKEELKNEEAMRDEQLAEIQKSYNEELISYDEFLAAKDKAELAYYARAKSVLERKNLTETAEYAALCKKEEELRTAVTKRIEKQQIASIKSTNAQEQTLNRAMYYAGEKDYLQYTADKERLDRELIDKQLKVYEEAGLKQTEQYARLLAKKDDLDEKQQQAHIKRTLAEIEAEHKLREGAATADYFDPASDSFHDKKALSEKLLAEDVRYLRERQTLYRKGTEEWAQLESQINDRVEQAKLDKQKEFAEAYQEFEKKYRRASGSSREKMEIDTLKQLNAKKLITEEEYQRALADIRDRYRKEDLDKEYRAQSEWGSIVTDMFNVMAGNWSEITDKELDMVDKVAIGAQVALSAISAMLSQYASYANAERDLELAKIEKRYDAEIKAAGNNEKKKKQIEERKEAEVAKIKKKYNDKAMKIELAQAVAQTALAAIAAYASASKVAFWLGPVAAAMATAAGMLQIATIKKQHEAEAAGYYDGGYTRRDPDNRKEVGVVHANEFVMNHKAVANPTLTPLLRLIDHAQRTNTVGSLTAADVAQAIGTVPRVGAGGSADFAPAVDILSGTFARMEDISTSTRASLERLNDNLEGGIETYVIMDGERGLYKKLKRYERINDNPRR